ncbi:MAG: hypothetical protein ACRDNF_02550 [Streptosporangiaceae bacterium]
MPSKPTTTAGQKRELRERMRTVGLDYRAIAAEFGRRYRLRPRAAWREAYGWSLVQAAEQINAFKGDIGLDPGGLCSMTASHLCEYENWPGHGEHPTGRRPTPYLLALLSRVYACSVIDLLDLADREHTPAADLLIIDTYTKDTRPDGGHLTPEADPDRRTIALPLADQDRQAILELRRGGEAQQARPAAGFTQLMGTPLAAAQPPAVAYRWIPDPDMGDPGVEREVMMTAHEGSDHAERAERRDIGDATLEQLHADLTRLSRELMTGEPFPLFREMRRVRNRMYAALERRLWPRDQSELYFLLSATSCLMSVAADDLGYRPAAEELARAGWAYAVVIDHRPVMAFLRLHLSRISFQQRPRQSRDLAASSLQYGPEGPNAVYAQLMYGRAAARLGDAEAAHRAITAAHEIRDRDHYDDLLEIGGEFDLSRASQHYLGGAVLIEVPGAEADVITELEQAAELYAAGPETGETHGFGMQALTHIDLAATQLHIGRLDAATAALAPVLSLASSQRIDALPARLERVRAALSQPPYQGSPQASDLDEQIEDFSQDTIGSELHELPLGPS